MRKAGPAFHEGFHRSFEPAALPWWPASLINILNCTITRHEASASPSPGRVQGHVSIIALANLLGYHAYPSPGPEALP
jgi:hypothetical protein